MNLYLIALALVVVAAIGAIVLIARPRVREPIDMTADFLPPPPATSFADAVEVEYALDANCQDQIDKAFREAVEAQIGSLDGRSFVITKDQARRLFCVRMAVLDVWIARHPDVVWTHDRCDGIAAGEIMISPMRLMRRRLAELMGADPVAELEAAGATGVAIGDKA